MINAYYALLLECRDAMDRWGLPPLTRLQLHARVRLRFLFSTDSELHRIGEALRDLGEDRNRANYDLTDDLLFALPRFAHADIQSSETALTRLDALDADPGGPRPSPRSAPETFAQGPPRCYVIRGEAPAGFRA
jgi:hypothetical protein